jgi:hypothetical protein
MRALEKSSTAAAVEVLLKAPDALAANSHTRITSQELHQMIACAAYFRAEKRGFECGYELEDWLGAESEIKRQLEQALH